MLGAAGGAGKRPANAETVRSTRTIQPTAACITSTCEGNVRFSSYLWLGPLILAAVSIGCAANQQVSGSACTPPPEGAQLDSDLDAEDLAGEYRIVMVGTTADYADRQIEGTLALHPQDSALQSLSYAGGVPITGARMPLYGALEAEVEEVGGMRLGDATVLDPSQPGVAVLEQVSPSGTGSVTSVTLRIGSDANRRDMVRFDGGFMALYVREITPEGFRGGWAAGVRGPAYEGYFCALRRNVETSGEG